MMEIRHPFYLLSLLTCLARVAVSGQVPPVKFTAPAHDFGRIDESDGKVRHTFEFVNTGGKPVVIEQVFANCGCIASEYTRKPVMPNATGAVTVVFDPAGRPGAFMRDVVVQTNGVKTRVHLSGTVLADRHGEYPVEMAGGFRVNKTAADFGRVGQGNMKTICVGFVNSSDRTVTLRIVGTGGGGAFTVRHPRKVAPGAKGCIVAVCDLREKEIWGNLHARLSICVDGVESDDRLALMAAAVDNFPSPDGSAPVVSFDRTQIDFGRVRPGDTRKTTVRLTNGGNAPLVIRAVKTPSNATCKLRSGVTVAPGGGVCFDVGMTFSSGDVSGRQSAAVTIVANDPARPVVEMELLGEISRM